MKKIRCNKNTMMGALVVVLGLCIVYLVYTHKTSIVEGMNQVQYGNSLNCRPNSHCGVITNVPAGESWAKCGWDHWANTCAPGRLDGQVWCPIEYGRFVKTPVDKNGICGGDGGPAPPPEDR